MDHAEIQTIRTQYQAGQWPQLLETVTLSGLRGWTGQTVSSISGHDNRRREWDREKYDPKMRRVRIQNADRSKRFFPSSFFVETHWDTISGVTIDYRVKRGASVRTYRTTKPSQRWRVPEDMPKRNVFLMDISRTLPLDASVGYAKIARQAAAEVSTSQIDNDLRGRLSHILGRDYRNARFAVSDADARREVGLLERERGRIVSVPSRCRRGRNARFLSHHSGGSRLLAFNH